MSNDFSEKTGPKIGQSVSLFDLKLFLTLYYYQEQARLEQSFVEKWRLEQQALLERWREDQRNHEREMLNMFTTFLSQTNKLFINKS